MSKEEIVNSKNGLKEALQKDREQSKMLYEQVYEEAVRKFIKGDRVLSEDDIIQILGHYGNQELVHIMAEVVKHAVMSTDFSDLTSASDHNAIDTIKNIDQLLEPEQY